MAAFRDLTIGQVLLAPCANARAQEIVSPGVMRYTYGDLPARLGRLASALGALGVAGSSVVAVMDWDSHRYFECYFAVPMLEATLHTINVRLSPEQILFTINHAADDVILCHADFAPLLAQIAGRIIRPVQIILLQDATGGDAAGLHVAGEYEALLAAGDPLFPFPEVAETTRATLFYTTGTTGDPKGVSFTHRQIMLHTLVSGVQLGAVPGTGGFHRGDVYMPMTPLFHVHAWGVPYLATLLGVTQIYPGRFEPGKYLGLIAEHGVTITHGVPTILNMLLAAPASAATDLSRLKMIVGGAALTPGLAQAALARGIDVHAGYGMSETCPILTLSDMTATQAAPGDVALRTASGKALPLVELRLMDTEGRLLPHDGVASGEVQARAPWLTEGYVANPDGTAALWQDGWLRTGDVGTIDAEGTLRIGDRLKDVIKSGGEWISSLDLESLVSRVPGLVEVAAIGLPDATWGERPCLVVALLPGGDAAAVLAGCHDAVAVAIAAGALPKWAAPHRIEVVEVIPKTSVGKLDKKKMRVMFVG